MALNPKQQRFVAEYVRDYNATQAAIRAGYSPKTAYSMAGQLLKKLEIQQALQQMAAKADITADRVLKERAAIAFFNPQSLFHADGRLKNVHEIDASAARAISGLDVETSDSGAVTLKYRFSDKNASLSALEKVLGMYRNEGCSTPFNIFINLDGRDDRGMKSINDAVFPKAVE